MNEQERKFLEIKNNKEDIGIATESLNRLPIFEPTNRPENRVREFENMYGKITVNGRLGQEHKSLLEVIMYKRKFHKEDNEKCIKVLYNEYEVKKYLSLGVGYNHETYKRLINDMKTAYIKIEKNKTIEGKLVVDKTVSTIHVKQTKSNLPGIKGKEIPYTILILGPVISELIEEELKFTYDPKPIIQLHTGISQAIVRYLKTHKRHPEAGYHLRELVANLTDRIEGQNWWNIKRFLKKDSNKLESLGIVIDFKKERLYVMEKQ